MPGCSFEPLKKRQDSSFAREVQTVATSPFLGNQMQQKLWESVS